MVWFKVDDVLPFHPRVLEAGNAAIGLWVRAGAWSMGQLTDGYVPKTMARQLGSAAEVRRLVQSGLWYEVEGGYQFHAWAESGDGAPRQPTREQVESKRKKDRERKASAGKDGATTRWNPSGSGQDSARNPGGIRRASDSPVPSRPKDSHVNDVSPVPGRARDDDDEQRAETRKQLLAALGISDYSRVKAELVKATGRPVTDEQAFRIVSGILAKAPGDVKKPQQYVLSSVRQSWAEIQQAIDEGTVAA